MAKAKELLDLLAARHSGDIFVPECKNGPTQSGPGMVRMDAWAMKRSWSNPHVYGYEIKVSRSDFLGDDKWHHYLPMCTHFSFVCAPGVCQPEEVPEGCGLIVASKTGTRLYAKRKAPRRDVQIHEDVWRYVLMCRARITADDQMRYGVDVDAVEEWRAWLAEKREKQEIGHAVSRRLRELYSERVVNVEIENKRLALVNERLSGLARVLDELGISPHSWGADEKLREAIENRRRTVSPRTICKAKRVAEAARELHESLCQTVGEGV